MRKPRTRGKRQRPRVTIVQEYVPRYRVDFFNGLREYLDARGVDLVVAAGNPGPRARTRGDAATSFDHLHIRHREFGFGGMRLNLRWLPRSVRTSDLIVVEQARRNVDVYLLLANPLTARRTASWGHGRDFTRHAGRWRRGLLALIARRSAHNFVYSAAGRDALLEQGVPGDRITVAPNAVDTTDLVAAQAELRRQGVQDWRDRWQVTGPCVAFIGALDAQKGLQLLAQAWRLVIDRDPSANLLIAGVGSEDRHFHTADGVLPGVRFIGYAGVLEKAAIAELAHAVIVPGLVGLVAVECKALGLHLVTVPARHAPEFEYLEPDIDVTVVAATAADLAEEIHRRLQASTALGGEGPLPGTPMLTMIQGFGEGICGIVRSVHVGEGAEEHA
jgi:glycosyltransferase involved in cell wall biosynthesis